jgi:hypothetical protein
VAKLQPDQRQVHRQRVRIEPVRPQATMYQAWKIASARITVSTPVRRFTRILSGRPDQAALLAQVEAMLAGGAESDEHVLDARAPDDFTGCSESPSW